MRNLFLPTSGRHHDQSTTQARFSAGGLAARWANLLMLVPLALGFASVAQATPVPISQSPLFVRQTPPPLIMLNMARDHKLFYEAYDDKSDLNNDGVLDVGYKGYQPGFPDYYGYFNSKLCYSYDTVARQFNPAAKAGPNHTCVGLWSGDFLNYLTTSRMDALRKVLYGGTRILDTATSGATPGVTVLERAYVPQDAHSWGKEYAGVAASGYNITQYTPLPLPFTGTRILFASTNPLCGTRDSADTADLACSNGYTGQPLLRVLQNSIYRVWNWVSIERPVAGHLCLSAGSRVNCAGPGGVQNLTVANTADFDSAISLFANAGNLKGNNTINPGSGNIVLNRTSMLASPSNDEITVLTGTLTIAAGKGGNYTFDINAGDAMEVLVTIGGVDTVVASRYGQNNATGKCANKATGSTAAWSGANPAANSAGAINLAAGNYPIKIRHHHRASTVGMGLCWKGPGVSDGIKWDWMRMTNGTTTGSSALAWNQWETRTPSSTLTDLRVRVKVCDTNPALQPESTQDDCKSYSNGADVTYKPYGLLQKFGDSDKVKWGLFSSSFRNNQKGGVLRKNVTSITDEIKQTTGQFYNNLYPPPMATPSPATMINKGALYFMDTLTTDGFGGDYQNGQGKDTTCGWITTGPATNGMCRSWGNPMAEMLFETVKYFAGKAEETTFSNNIALDTAAGGGADGDYVYSINGLKELRRQAWKSPYEASGLNNPWCAKPFVMSISDVNTSYDDDDLPGSVWSSGLVANPFTTAMNVSTLANTLWNNEFSGAQNVYVGYVQGNPNNAKGVPSPKTASTFANIKGNAPEEPTKNGSYYSGAVAYYAHTTKLYDMNHALPNRNQSVSFYSIVLNSPLPSIDIPLSGGRKITMVPFAKSPGNDNGTQWSGFFPTDQIVDFYIDSIYNAPGGIPDAGVNGGRAYYKFRINFEDVEQGADHDMDAIAIYEVMELDPTANAGNNVQINVTTEYQAGGITQHMGYVISGTTADGTYLEVADCNSTNCKLVHHPDDWNAAGLDLTHSRQFAASSGPATSVWLHDPLWYAAKYGAFVDSDTNNLPNLTAEWKKPKLNSDGSVAHDSGGNVIYLDEPKTYFKVTSPLQLKQQMDDAISDLLTVTGGGAAVAATTSELNDGAAIYQAIFKADNNVWSGGILKKSIDPYTGAVAPLEQWDANTVLYNPSAWASRKVYTYKDASSGVQAKRFEWGQLNLTEQNWIKASGSLSDPNAQEVVDFIRGKDTAGNHPNGVKLGTVVNSTPVLVGAPSSNLYEPDKMTPAVGYATFKTANASRQNTLWFGANDGMVHGINADTGRELFAYIPYQALQNITGQLDVSAMAVSGAAGIRLAATHKYYVDGSPTAADVKLDDGWKTVLVGGMNAGGSTIYALDVTDPLNMDQNSVMWEFSSRNDADMGLSYSRPRVYKMNFGSTGKWAVVFGNGYNSANEKAVLYIAFLDGGRDGTWTLGTDYIRLVADPASTGPQGNGLSSPAGIDTNIDGMVDYIYAGDLHGNMWKFDVSNANPALWSVALSGQPLFVAKDSSNKVQPITAPPAISFHPTLKGIDSTAKTQMVYFGTGKYLENCDADSVTGCTYHSNSHSYYGVWDHNDANIDRSKLVKQDFAYSGTARYISSDNAVNWYVTSTTTPDRYGWYHEMDAAKKEKVIAPSIVFGTRVYYTTLIPEGDVCSPAGITYLMQPCKGTGSATCDGKTYGGVGDPGDPQTAAIGGVTLVKLKTPTTPANGTTGNWGGDFKSITQLNASTDDIKLFAIGSSIEGGVNGTNIKGQSGGGRISWKELLRK